MSRRLLVIINPAAAGGQSARQVAGLLARLSRAGLRFESCQTERPGHAVELAANAAGMYDVVVAAGGDGTANEVASGILRSRGTTALGVLPIGTGNDFASQLGIRSLSRATTTLVKGGTSLLDTIEVSFGEAGRRHTRHALVFAAVGFGAELLKRTTPRVKRLFGQRLCYSVGFLRALASYQTALLQVSTEAGVFRGRLFHVSAGNAEYVGGGAMRLSPGARLDDGQLEVCVVDHLSWLEALFHATRLLRGTHPAHHKVHYFRGHRLEIESQPPVPLELDGDVLGSTPATFRVRPQSLGVLVPAT